MKTTRTLLATIILSTGLLTATGAQAALQYRLGGLALYDTDLNITWLANANVNGLMTWRGANTWASGLTVSGVSGWRLPTSDTCSGFNCTGSEMGHLFYNELGGVVGQSIGQTHNASYRLFQNFVSYYYWSGTAYSPTSNNAWNFDMRSGSQFPHDKGLNMFALAVHPGDVAAVPEAESWAMLLAGLGLVGVATRRRRV